jgi:hypothetical protein
MPILIPGRHHCLTAFQAKYLFRLMNGGTILDTRGEPVQHTDSVVFAVTSANHEGTKRNPIPFHLRALTIQDFARDIIPVPTYIYGIDDVGHLDDFRRTL